MPLESFEMTLTEFRLLEVLYREGALPVVELARRRGSEWHHVCDIIEQLEKRGWLRRGIAALPPVEFERAHLPKSSARRSGEGGS